MSFKRHARPQERQPSSTQAGSVRVDPQEK